MEKFSLEKVHKLYNDGVKKDHIDCKEYIQQYCFQTEDGDFFLLVNDKLKHFSIDKFKTAFSNAFPTDIKKWFFTQNLRRYTVDMDLSPDIPQVSHNPPVLNLGKTFMHRKKDYNSYSDNIKEKVEFYLAFLKEVFCDNSEKLLTYLLLWLAVVANGKKNETILYIKTALEGVGKSKLLNMLINHVFGPNLCCESDEQPLTTNFNSILMGKALVFFDELEVFNSQWAMANTRLRRWSTSDTVSYTKKGDYCFGPHSLVVESLPPTQETRVRFR